MKKLLLLLLCLPLIGYISSESQTDLGVDRTDLKSTAKAFVSAVKNRDLSLIPLFFVEDLRETMTFDPSENWVVPMDKCNDETLEIIFKFEAINKINGGVVKYSDVNNFSLEDEKYCCWVISIGPDIRTNEKKLYVQDVFILRNKDLQNFLR
jgi:hypothetical protein